MLEQLEKNWWMFTVRGIAAILFGLGAFAWPGITVAVLIALFGGYALIDGLAAIVTAVRNRKEIKHWWAILLNGIVGVLAGLAAWSMPGLTAVAFVYLIAGWALATGVVEVVSAIRLRKEIEGEWFYVLAGIASIVFAVTIARSPAVGALAVLWLIGSYAIAFGILLFAFSLRLHGSTGRPSSA